MTIEMRAIQTQMKHRILKRYLSAWGGIILNGLKNQAAKRRQLGQAFTAQFVYVDCFASSGRYAGDMVEVNKAAGDKVVFGSPVIGIQALDQLADEARNKYQIDLRTNAILVEKKLKEFKELQTSLNLAGLSERVKFTNNFTSLRDGEIAALRADSTTVVSDLTAYTTRNYTFAFYLIDPYGPTGNPLNFVRQVVSLPRHDVMINMMYMDLHKKVGTAEKLLPSQADEKILQNYDAMFGHTRWQTFAAQLDSGEIWERESHRLSGGTSNVLLHEDVKDLEAELVRMYRDSLQGIDQTLAVKALPLRFPDKNRTMFYLYLTTHDPTGALKMNEILQEGGFEERDLRERLRSQRRQKDSGQQTIFEALGIAPEELQRAPDARPSKDEVANVIFELLCGQEVNRRDVYRALVNEWYWPKEVDAALKVLKRQKRVSFSTEELTHKTILTFS